MWPNSVWIFFIVFSLLAILRTIDLFNSFGKLSMLLRFSRDIIEVWVRVCCVHLFLVNIQKVMSETKKIKTNSMPLLYIEKQNEVYVDLKKSKTSPSPADGSAQKPDNDK